MLFRSAWLNGVHDLLDARLPLWIDGVQDRDRNLGSLASWFEIELHLSTDGNGWRAWYSDLSGETEEVCAPAAGEAVLQATKELLKLWRETKDPNDADSVKNRRIVVKELAALIRRWPKPPNKD